MKKNLFIALSVFSIITSIYAQEQGNHFIGGHFSFGKSDYSMGDRFITTLIPYTSEKYTAQNYYTLGFDYSHKASGKEIEFCTGFSATIFDMNLTSTYYQSGGSSNTSEYDDKFFIFSVPIHLKLHFLKYLFVGGGVNVNYHPHKGYKWGIGPEISAGAEYTFNSGMTISISPRIQWNLLNFLKPDESSFGIDKLRQIGVNIGFGYRF